MNNLPSLLLCNTGRCLRTNYNFLTLLGSMEFSINFDTIKSGWSVVQDFSKECLTEKSTKSYVVGTQKNRFNEMVLLSTQNIC